MIVCLTARSASCCNFGKQQLTTNRGKHDSAMRGSSQSTAPTWPLYFCQCILSLPCVQFGLGGGCSGASKHTEVWDLERLNKR